MKKLYLLCTVFLILGLIGCHADAPSAGGDQEVIPPPNTKPPILNADRELLIRENFFEWRFGENDSFYTLDNISVSHYYGTFREREVVTINVTYMDFSAAIDERNVAGYDFFWGMGGGTNVIQIHVHDNGDFMCFSEAYERGYLTAEDIGVIWAQHREGWLAVGYDPWDDD